MTPTVRSRPAAATAFLAVLAALGLLLFLARRVWFFADDWAFLLGRSVTRDPVSALFAPHNEHWSTVPVLVFRLLYALVGVRHYLPYAVPVLLAHAVVCLMVWVLTRRAGASPWAATVAVVVVAFLGAGAEDLVWDFQVGFVGSVAFGLVALAAADRGGRAGGAVAVAALVLAFASSGMGVVMWVLFAAVVWLRAGWRAALVLAGGPALVFLLWFALEGRRGLSGDGTPRVTYLQLPEYVWHGLTSAWGDASGIGGAGPTLVVSAVVGVLVAAGRGGRTLPPPLRALAAAGVGSALFLYLFVGLTRVRYGVEQAAVSRYAYVAVVLGSFALAAAVTALLPARSAVAGPDPGLDVVEPDDRGPVDPAAGEERRGVGTPERRVVAVGLVVVAGLVAVAGIRQLVSAADERAVLTAQIRPQVLGAVVLAREGAPVLTDRAEDVYTPDVLMSALRRPEVQEAFGHVTTTPQGSLDARAAVQTGVGATDPGLPAPASLTWTGVTGPTPAATGCTSGDAAPGATIEMTPGADGRAAFRLTGVAPTVQVVLVADGGTSVSVPRTVAAAGTWIGTVADRATVRVTIPQVARVTVCADGA